ncbi:MAG TPA: hypothetical protein VFP80_03685, partial [Thermoanaerobaculia bacterium]|nr:hypothetical protein [Thermoanaerobaculia bacterium]
MRDDPVLRYYARMREAKESELQAIRSSWTWRLLNRLRNWKYRLAWTNVGRGFSPPEGRAQRAEGRRPPAARDLLPS